MKSVSKTALIALLGTTALAAPLGALAQDAPVTDDVITVRGVNIPDEKRVTSEISSIVDEESFQRTGDGDIGAALRRVTGLSLTQGKFVVVRGLNERYSTVTLDGSPLPSPEPLRRVVPLDIIPTSILSGSLVQKTYSPQFSGEFGGGLVELRSKAVPDEFYMEIGGTLGIDTVTSFSEGLTYDGGERDWLGFDDGARNIPTPVANAFFGSGGVQPFDQETVDRSFDNTDTTVILEQDIPPNYKVNFAIGDAYDLNSDVRFGFNIAAGFGNDFQTREGRRDQGLTNTASALAGAQPFDDLPNVSQPDGATLFDFTSTTQIAEMNLLGSLGFLIGDNHEISSTTLLLRSTLKDARVSTGIIPEEDDREFQRENIEFFERQVWQTQLRGEHFFPELFDLEAKWRFAYGEAFRDSPYQRQVLKSRTSANDEFALLFGSGRAGSLSTGAATLTFSDVEDENIDAGVDFTLPIEFGSQFIEFDFGYAYTDKQRDTIVRDFSYVEGSLGVPDPVLTARNDVVFGPGVVGTDALNVNFITNPISLDNADSSLEVNALYAGLDWETNQYLRFALGVRFEDSVQTTTAFATGAPGTSLSTTEIDEDYILPAATITWNPLDDFQVRAGYSQTITRPQFRELTPATFIDDDTDQQIIGNPFLVNSEIDNYDLRFEYYFARGQFATLGFFYKDIENPIEATNDVQGGSALITYLNAPSAELYGFELEFERRFLLSDWFEQDLFATKDLFVASNYTFTQSEVSADGEVNAALVDSNLGAQLNPNTNAADFIEDGRSLQGQSDHLFNFQLGIEDVEVNSRATILVNFASERIRQTENIVDDAPAVLERPPVTIDFVWSRTFEKFGGEWEAGFAVRNILGEEYEAVMEFEDGTSADFDVYDLGREVSFSLKRRF